ncbi:MAG: hypothetical protein V4501_07005 [Pseudomonadota bacterium]
MPKGKRKVLQTKKKPKSSPNTLLHNIVKFSTGVWIWHTNSAKASAISPGKAVIQNLSSGNSRTQNPERPDMFTQNILGVTQKTCWLKQMGINQGRKCLISDKTYFMKLANDQTNFRFQEAYNLLFLKNVLNINTPQFGYVQDGQLYFATLEVPAFNMAVQLQMNGPDFQAQLSNTISSSDIAKLAVARTFIADLTKLENWGYTPEGLAIIDADGGLHDDGTTIMPKTAEEYFKLASESMSVSDFSAPFHLGFELNLDHIAQMKTIYEKMRLEKLPDVDPSVNLDKTLYAEVLNVYIKTCNSILTDFSAYDKKTLSTDINKAFAKAVLNNGLLNLKIEAPGSTKTSTVIEIGKSILSSAAEQLDTMALSSIAVPAIQNLAANVAPKFIKAAVKTQQKTFLNKSEVELQDMLIPTLVVASGTVISALSIIYVLWKKYNESPTNTNSPQLFTRAPSNSSVRITINTSKNPTQKSPRK